MDPQEWRLSAPGIRREMKIIEAGRNTRAAGCHIRYLINMTARWRLKLKPRRGDTLLVQVLCDRLRLQIEQMCVTKCWRENRSGWIYSDVIDRGRSRSPGRPCQPAGAVWDVCPRLPLRSPANSLKDGRIENHVLASIWHKQLELSQHQLHKNCGQRIRNKTIILTFVQIQ